MQLDATKPEGILYADIQTNIIPQLTQIITDKDSSKVESSIKALLATYEKKGLAALEDAWTVQYDKMVSRK